MNCLRRRIKLQEKDKKISLILSIVLLIVILFLGVIYINKNMPKNKIYQLENKTYYEVTLNPNDYFLNDKLEASNLF